jgi:hypothetical protein
MSATDDELRRLAEAVRDARAAYIDAPSFDNEYAWHNAVSALKRGTDAAAILALLDRLRDSEARGMERAAEIAEDERAKLVSEESRSASVGAAICRNLIQRAAAALRASAGGSGDER